jgi:hypothetical protein
MNLKKLSDDVLISRSIIVANSVSIIGESNELLELSEEVLFRMSDSENNLKNNTQVKQQNYEFEVDMKCITLKPSIKQYTIDFGVELLLGKNPNISFKDHYLMIYINNFPVYLVNKFGDFELITNSIHETMLLDIKNSRLNIETNIASMQFLNIKRNVDIEIVYKYKYGSR